MNQDGLLALGANEMVPKGMAFEWSFFRKRVYDRTSDPGHSANTVTAVSMTPCRNLVDGQH